MLTFLLLLTLIKMAMMMAAQQAAAAAAANGMNMSAGDSSAMAGGGGEQGFISAQPHHVRALTPYRLFPFSFFLFLASLRSFSPLSRRSSLFFAFSSFFAVVQASVPGQSGPYM
jgi:hypothetical protein